MKHEKLQSIQPSLAREILIDSPDTHRFTVFEDGYPDTVTTIDYRCTEYGAAVFRVCSPEVEYAFHGLANDVFSAYEKEVQAELNECSRVDNEIFAEYELGSRPSTGIDVNCPDNVTFEQI
jgi:hypothetical protein